ncbi:MAG: hypothetical protein B7Z43_00435 [Sphingomonas sp. 12-62-6]|nr:MAG: hypothetical protein B7Z43_00435 [Sphingomonas sp. 12-62-6]
MVDSIVNTLGAGSGIDLTSLVNDLVNAQFNAKTQSIQRQSQTISAQISGAATVKSSVTDFAAGLKSLATGGLLSTTPTSSNTSIVKASALPGAKLSGLSATLEVRQLAQAQSVATAAVADRTTAIGTGTLTLTFGSGSVGGGSFVAGSAAPIDIPVVAGASSLESIAASINAANAGVTASIITDSSGARLALKSKTGADQAFTLTATEDVGAPGLAALAITPAASGALFGTVAQDAIVAVDGIPLSRSSNSISDLVDGVKLDLVSESVGTKVALGTNVPTEQLRSSVNDLVAAFNDLQRVVKSQSDATNGALFNDSATRQLQQSLRRFTQTELATPTTAGAPRNLSDIGVSTNRDGSLSVNADRLTAAITDFPDAVEALFFNGTGATGGGIAAAFQAIADQATSTTTGLRASESRYAKRQASLDEALEKANADKEVVRTRLTRQFAGADARVSAYKSTQSFLTQQFAPKTNN